MANISKKYKEMEYRMYIFHLVETVEHRTRYVTDTFGKHPEKYPTVYTDVKMLYCNKYHKPHKHKASCLDVVVFLEREEAQKSAYKST